MSNYRLSREAGDDLLAIFFTGLEMFGYQHAEAYRNGLSSAFEQIARNPQMARTREEIDGVVRALPHRAHVIIYEVKNTDEVVILRVRHQRENWLSDPF